MFLLQRHLVGCYSSLSITFLFLSRCFPYLFVALTWFHHPHPTSSNSTLWAAKALSGRSSGHPDPRSIRTSSWRPIWTRKVGISPANHITSMGIGIETLASYLVCNLCYTRIYDISANGGSLQLFTESLRGLTYKMPGFQSDSPAEELKPTQTCRWSLRNAPGHLSATCRRSVHGSGH